MTETKEEFEERYKHQLGVKLYEQWNTLWVEQTGAESRPYDRMSSEDPREACMWDELAYELDKAIDEAKVEEAEGREMEEAER